MNHVTELRRRGLQSDLLEKLVELLPIGVWLTDAEGNIVLGNEAGRRIWAGARYVGLEQYGEYKGWWPDGRPIAAAEWPLARALTHGETRLGDVIDIECFDGTRKTIRNSAMPIRDGAGRLLGALVTNEDITEARRLEKTLGESSERMDIVARATTDVVWDWNLDTDAIWWNDNFYALFGYAPGTRKPTIESWTDYIHPEDKPRIEAEVRAAREGTATQWSGEYRFLRADGSYADVFDRGTFMRDASGRAVRMIGAMMDITARKAAERALRESEQRFRSLLVLSSDWYWEQDEALRFRVSEPMPHGERRPSGYMGRTRWEIVGASLEDPKWAAHRDQLLRREPFQDFEYERESADGVARWVSISGEPVFDAQGRFRGYRGVGRDITARKRAEQERVRLARLYASLSAVNELVIRARSSAELLQGACEIAVASGEFTFAVARMIDPGVAAANVAALAGEGYPDWLRRPLALGPGGPDEHSLLGHAWRTGRPVVAGRDGLTTPALERLVRETGVRAAGVFPIVRGDAMVGALVLTSRDPAAFDGETGTLLERMAANVAHGLDALEAQQAQQRFRLALDQSADLIALVDAETLRYVDVNDTTCRVLGYCREEMVVMTVDRIHAVDPAELRRQYAQVISGDPAAEREFRARFRRRDGSSFPTESKRRAIRSGDRWLIVTVARDATERDAAEQALRRQDAFFRSLVENVSDALAATDMEWRYVYVAPSTSVLTGYSREETLGKRFLDTVLDGQGPALREALAQRLAATGEPQSIRVSIRRKDGAVRSHEIMVSKAAGPDGEPIYVVAGRDITERVEAEETLRRFRLALDRSGELIALIDLETLRYVDVNDSLCAALGYTRQELLEMHPDELIPHTRAELRETYTRLTRGEEVPAVRSYYRRKDGSQLPYESRRHAVQSADGRWLIVSIARDIRRELAAEEAMRKREEEFRAVAENAPDGIMRFDLDLRCLYANQALARTTGRPVGFFIGRRLSRFGIPQELAESLGAALRRALETGETQSLEFTFTGPLGERHYAARLAPERGPDGRPVSVIGISRDVTDRRRFEARIEHLASHDRLTGLPNRALLGDRVGQAILHARRTQGVLALLFVDLDQFKLVNDSFGHAAGDALLMEVAARLRATVREGDTVARLGGDEFVILLTGLGTAEDSAVVARKIAHALDRPIALEAGELSVTASIGIGLYPADGDSLEALLQCADAAMYRAKDSGRNTFQYYSAEMGEQARARVETEAGLRRAIERDELRLHYQPQVSLASGEVVAFEALLRWQHPQRGLVAPGAFIPVAEESGLIVPIGQWALVAACREAAAWAADGRNVRVAVNLSARQFWRGSVTEAVRVALGETGLAPSRLEVEITESVVARDLQQVMVSLEQLRRMGVTVAIDDFGVGYSSLAYLRTLPISKLKIDKSFIHSIPSDREATALVSEIVRLAHALSLEVVAEGVETAEQAETLRAAGCEAMQGFLFSRPVPPAECRALLRSGRRFQP